MPPARTASESVAREITAMILPARLRRFVVGILLGFAFAALVVSSATAADCEFRLGFKTLRDLIGHDTVGDCLSNEQHSANGDSTQSTTGGLMVWRKADNYTAFTDGHYTWVNGPYGLQQRLNSERFPWESDYTAGADAGTQGLQLTPTPVLPLAPAPAGSIGSGASGRQDLLVEVVFSVQWPTDTSGSISWSGGAPFSLLESDGNAESYRAYVCPPADADQSVAIAVILTSAGDGVTYRSGPGQVRLLTLTVSCPTASGLIPTPALTPTPADGGLPPPPVPAVSLDYGIHVENYNAWSDKGVVEVRWSYSWPEGVASIETDGIAGSHTWTSAQTPPTYALVCLPSQAGETATHFLRLRAFGDGETYRQAWSDWSDYIGVTVTCPFPTTALPAPPPGTGPAPPPSVDPGSTPTPGGPTPAPTVTPTVPQTTPTVPQTTPTPGGSPTPTTLPLPPSPSLSLSSSPNENDITITLTVTIPYGVAEARTSGNLFNTQTGRTGNFLKGQPYSVDYTAQVCIAAQGGQTLSFAVNGVAKGDGAIYRDAWGPQGTSTISVTCPGGATPTPVPTPTLPLPSAPSLSLSSTTSSDPNNGLSMMVIASVTFENGVDGIRFSGNLFTSGWSRGNNQGTYSASFSEHVCSSGQAGQTLDFTVNVVANGDGVIYRDAWSSPSTSTISVTCPGEPPPTPTPTPTLALPPSPSLSLSSSPSGDAITITLTVTLASGVAEVKTSGNLFNTQTGRTGDFKKGQPYSKSYAATVCSASQGGQTLTFNVNGVAKGDGETYRDAWGPQTTTSISVTCPASPTPTPTPNPS